jgi:hypothetical protein
MRRRTALALLVALTFVLSLPAAAAPRSGGAAFGAELRAFFGDLLPNWLFGRPKGGEVESVVLAAGCSIDPFGKLQCSENPPSPGVVPTATAGVCEEGHCF